MPKKTGKSKKKPKFSAADLEGMTLCQLERLLTLRQRKFVAHLHVGHGQAKSAELAGYSPKTAASIASGLMRNAKVSAYRRAFTAEMLEHLCLTPEAIVLRIYGVYEQCMGEDFDSRGALKALELLGKNAGMFKGRHELELGKRAGAVLSATGVPISERLELLRGIVSEAGEIIGNAGEK